VTHTSKPFIFLYLRTKLLPNSSLEPTFSIFMGLFCYKHAYCEFWSLKYERLIIKYFQCSTHREMVSVDSILTESWSMECASLLSKAFWVVASISNFASSSMRTLRWKFWAILWPHEVLMPPLPVHLKKKMLQVYAFDMPNIFIGISCYKTHRTRFGIMAKSPIKINFDRN